MLQKFHGHGLTKGAIIQIFYHSLDEHTQRILDITAGGIFLYKSPNQAFQFLKDKVLFEHDWSIKSQNDHHQKSVSFTDGSDSNSDNSRFIEKLKAMDSQIISLNEELEDIHNKYNKLKEGNASKNHLNDDTPMCERHEANYIQFEGYQNRNSYDSFSHKSLHDPNDSKKSNEELEDIHNKYNKLKEGNASKNHLNDDTPMCERHEANYIQFEGYQNRNSYDSFSHQSLHDPNDSKKSLTELNNDVRNDLEDFKRRIRSMRTVHWKLYDSDDDKNHRCLT
ncbi:hypothetical protein Tco_1286950 [Tanacetum coccineum]